VQLRMVGQKSTTAHKPKSDTSTEMDSKPKTPAAWDAVRE
jgi:hypothetical protein